MSYSAIILGAGPNVGRAVAERLLQGGWKVALGSRSIDVDKAKSEGFVGFKIDLTHPETVAPTLEKVNAELGGAPNVVIYNAYHGASSSLPDPADPLSHPLSTILENHNVGFASVYEAAKFATKGFATLPASSPRVFIAGGNPLPFLPAFKSRWLTLGLGKHNQAYLIDYLSQSNKDKGYQYYFASQVKSATQLLGLDEFNGPTHAVAYWHLINSKKQGAWDARFIKDGSFVTDN